MEKILTVTIPSYNVEAYLEEILPTFLEEKILDKIEILVVNDGSADRTEEIAEKYEKLYPRTVRAINKENGGHGSTINKGIQIASGKYFKVVDGDDWVDSKAFVAYVEKLENLDCDAIGTPFVRVNEVTKEKEKKSFSDIEFEKEYLIDNALKVIGEGYTMHALTFKTEILKKIQAISEKCFYVDQEYIIYPLKFLNNIIFLDLPIYQYRVGNNEQSMSVKNKQKNREMHKKVINNLIDYYQKEKLSFAKRSFVEKKISGMINTQIRIYLSFSPSSMIKKELTNFTDEMKRKVPDIYSRIPGKLNIILRKSNNNLYQIVAKYYSNKCI